MDLAGIGAVAAPVVALVAIPATVFAVRWQVKAALRSAEATHRAGLAQAEATYRAAVDTSRAVHEQWRLSLRRDAYAAFLSALGKAAHAADEFDGSSARSAVECSASLLSWVGEIRDALAVVELEGPAEASATAEASADRFSDWQRTMARCADYLGGLGYLEELRAGEGGSPAGTATPGTNARAALARLDRLLHERPVGTDATPELRAAREAFAHALGDCPGIRPAHAAALLSSLRSAGGSPYGVRLMSKLGERRHAFWQARTEFLSAAHTALAIDVTRRRRPSAED
ncbi:hypothetical protein [Streptomyces sp. H27-C3]|uniref:hypothetical protein n=1 Tax=Streptomyces sp. H27-C3 TaxID=3046305 RepID=UPI0024BB0E36|nr:hypothetical protein [Streptomyces sp. H27-C3]MDJ0466446.1 hypothetical protein [Streptomyces sp. H27-C3]